MTDRCEALVLGIGNVLWADEGFGVRAIEALHAQYVLPDSVAVVDGGTQGVYLYGAVAAARRVLVFDAIDFGLAPGTLRVLRNGDVPAWSRGKLSPHQTGFNDILALAQLRGEAPETMTLIGVQPEELSDLGGSLRPSVRARIPEAVEIAARELAAWGFRPRARERDVPVAPLNAPALGLVAYESGRPSSEEACRIGDPRVLARTRF
ncbi:MAG TPA: HyaD/HybD family hydrogenase maturation endopeptidase [Casimicrobiaceae bacterium]|nr:HyaD/HybD family hydrogenase maturation endopeptidase [Casimicrobiaceae bacterium]